jgi:hypothetical protein
VTVGASLVSTLLTCFELFIQVDWSGRPCVECLRRSTCCRNESIIGHCVNLLPLRSKLNLNLSCSDYLKQRKSELFDAYEYPQLSFGQLLQN